jgi:hypothetical protein
LSGDQTEQITSAEEVSPTFDQPEFDTKETETIGSTEIDDKFVPDSSDKSDDAMSYFKKLANDG